MVEVHVSKSEWSTTYGSYVIELREREGARTCPVYVDELEARLIEFLNQRRTILPFTASRLIPLLMDKVGVALLHVLIFKQFFGEVMAKVTYEHAGRLHTLIAQPGPAIELALRCDIPIHVQDSLLIGDDEAAGERRREGRELSELQAELQRAIETENFERAARLRDQINKLQARSRST